MAIGEEMEGNGVVSEGGWQGRGMATGEEMEGNRVVSEGGWQRRGMVSDWGIRNRGNRRELNRRERQDGKEGRREECLQSAMVSSPLTLSQCRPRVSHVRPGDRGDPVCKVKQIQLPQSAAFSSHLGLEPADLALEAGLFVGRAPPPLLSLLAKSVRVLMGGSERLFQRPHARQQLAVLPTCLGEFFGELGACETGRGSRVGRGRVVE